MNSTVVVVDVDGVACVTDGVIDVNVLNNMTVEYIHGLFINDVTLFQRTTDEACEYIFAIIELGGCDDDDSDDVISDDIVRNAIICDAYHCCGDCPGCDTDDYDYDDSDGVVHEW